MIDADDIDSQMDEDAPIVDDPEYMLNFLDDLDPDKEVT
jgi:hypothetical protein